MDFNTWTLQCWLTIKNLHTSTLCKNWIPPRGLTKNNDWWLKRELRELILLECTANDYDGVFFNIWGCLKWLGDWGSIPGWVIPKTQKWYLIPPCLTLSITRHVSRVKWNNPGKGVMPSPTPQCCSYWKGTLQFALDYYKVVRTNILFSRQSYQHGIPIFYN